MTLVDTKKSEDWKVEALKFLGGFVTGAALHHIAAETKKRNKLWMRDWHEPYRIHGRDVGAIISSMSIFIPDKLRPVLLGTGAGMIAHDFYVHWIDKMNIQPLTTGNVCVIPLTTRFSKLVHIPPEWPLSKKEEVIIPLFADTIQMQRESEKQVNAIDRYCNELNIGEIFSLDDALWSQCWFLYYGRYVRREGLWLGHDRWRLLSNLLEQRDSGKVWKKFGKIPGFYYDCDCAALSLNQVVDSRSHPIHFILISQRPKVDSVHPLHHVFVGMQVQEQIYAVELIKPLPILPIQYLGRLFKNLKRVVIVNNDKTYYEYTDWQKYSRPW